MYDLEREEATFGGAKVDGRALVWQLDRDEGEAEGALVSRAVQLDPFASWVARCDRIDFPLGGVAHRHTHPGPGIRYLLRGELEIETEGRSTFYGPGGAWFESGPEPVVARASAHLETSFVRLLLLPAEWAGKRTIRYLDELDDTDAPAVRVGPPRAPDHRSAVSSRTGGRILVDQLALHGAELAFGVPGESYIDVLDALRDSSVRFVTCRHEAGAANMAEAYGKLTGQPGRLPRHARPRRDAGVGRRAHRVPGRDASRPPRRPDPARRRWARGIPGARLPPGVRLVREVGRPDRPGRPDPRARGARVPDRDLGPAGPGRPGAAGGRARRPRRRAGRVALRRRLRRRRAQTSSRHAARAARGRGAAARDRRRAAVDGGCGPAARRLARGERRARRRCVALPGLRGQRRSLLRGPPRTGTGPGAHRAPSRRRHPARRRRAPRRHRDLGLLDRDPARRRAHRDPRPPGPRRARSGLRAGTRHRRLRSSLRERPGRAGSRRRSRATGGPRRGPLRLPSRRWRAVRCPATSR